MTKPIIRIHNIETNEVIDREMNAEELSQHNKMLETLDAEKAIADAEAEAKAEAKAALLEQLGITEEQAKLLLS